MDGCQRNFTAIIHMPSKWELGKKIKSPFCFIGSETMRSICDLPKFTQQIRGCPSPCLDPRGRGPPATTSPGYRRNEEH